MISPVEIRKQAERWWPEVLRAALTGVPFFPRKLSRIGKVKSAERLRSFDRIRREQDALIAQSKAQRSFGYTLEWETRNFRDIGENRFIKSIEIPTLEDYLALLGQQRTYTHFCADAAQIRRAVPELADWCIDHPLEIEKYHGEWPDLIRLVRYFLDRHEPGRYYIRELPVEVPTKFVESHQAVLTSIFQAVLPASKRFEGTTFEQRFGLKDRQPLIRIRLLDSNIGQTYFSGLTDFSLPVSDFNQLALPLRRVIILENKTNFTNVLNFLTLPQSQGTAAVFGSGFGVGRLRNAAWLREVRLFYWGDIDAHGLQILSQLRGYFPHLEPLLMDRATFDVLSGYQVAAPESKVQQPPNLKEAEQLLFDYLNTHQLRLEQEHVPQAMVQTAFFKLNDLS